MSAKKDNVYRDTSIPHGPPCGGDTHAHFHKDGATVTDRFKGNVEVHTNFDNQGNSSGTNVTYGNKTEST
jgi:hypothetical protein